MKNIYDKILKDMRVELHEMFDSNFRAQGFFGKKWKPKKHLSKGGSRTILIVTGAMRRGIRSQIRGNGVVFTSDKPYTALHNEGGVFMQTVRAHTRNRGGKTFAVKSHRRAMSMPQRQFIGDHPRVQEAIQKIVAENLHRFSENLVKQSMK